MIGSIWDAKTAQAPLMNRHLALRSCGIATVALAFLTGLPWLAWGVFSFYTAVATVRDLDPAAMKDGASLGVGLFVGMTSALGLALICSSLAWIVVGAGIGLALQALADIADELRWARLAEQSRA